MRTKLIDRILPRYSQGEEIFNMVSHIVGGALGITALTLCVIISAINRNVFGVVSSSIYGFTMILLYTMSSIYHGLKHEMAKKVFQVLDHCAIYFLIAGTYTPIALSAIMKVSPAFAWSVFGVEWGLAALATTLTAIDIKKYQAFSMTLYIAMGWGIMFFPKIAIAALTFNGFIYLLIGGLFYTVGAILYAIGKKKKNIHGVFHVFCFLGSLFHFFCILFYGL